MNKKFATFLSGYGMEINGNFAYGTVKGYETNANVIMLDNVAPLRIHISFYATAEQKQSIESEIKKLSLKFFIMNLTPYGISLGFNDITANRLLKKLPDILPSIFEIISNSGAQNSGFCPVCGLPLDESNSKKCNIDGFNITLDNDCVNKINNVINVENQDFDNAPNNYLKGFLGALIGGLVGAAISIILYLIGFVSALSAFVSILLGTALYQKFHGKPNKVMIVIVSLTTLVLLAATIPAIYITAASGLAIIDGLHVTAIEAFKIYMQDAEFSRMFYADLAMVVLFSVIGSAYEIYALTKKIKRKTNI